MLSAKAEFWAENALLPNTMWSEDSQQIAYLVRSYNQATVEK